jgi:acyl carrier protein
MLPEDLSSLTDATTMTERIRAVIAQHGHLPVDISSIGNETDLFQAGMTSHASVNLMLGLEAEFDVEFPDVMLKRSVFQSVAAIATAIASLDEEAA